ncbi:MAG: YraN family protein [Clostridia bacterium]|nr:YraN family protein [Clostridia bacterium]
MKETRQLLGKLGEEAACRALVTRGHSILCRNFRCRFGEIDIISRDRDAIVFTEVKTRSGLLFGTPAEAVDRKKRMRITNSAIFFLKQNNINESFCRFDVIEVLNKGGKLRCRHIKNAF